MKKLFLIILLGFCSALTAFAAVDIRLKKNLEMKIKTQAVFTQNELIDLNLPFTDLEAIDAKAGMILSDSEDKVMKKTLQNGQLISSELHDFISVFKKLLQGEVFTSDERKYLLGITGENRKAEDRIKFLARRKLKEPL